MRPRAAPSVGSRFDQHTIRRLLSSEPSAWPCSVDHADAYPSAEWRDDRLGGAFVAAGLLGQEGSHVFVHHDSSRFASAERSVAAGDSDAPVVIKDAKAALPRSFVICIMKIRYRRHQLAQTFSL